MDPARNQPSFDTPPEFVWADRPKFQDRVRRHVILFLLTVLTTTGAGAGYYANFASDLSAAAIPSASVLFLHGLWYSGTVLLILGCHEFGHYFACRYYDVDASLPYFLPVPLPLTGTFGAFIRIREPFPSKRALFDIGIAGPIAGFVVAAPALFIGLAMSRIIPATQVTPGAGWIEFGEPLLMKIVQRLMDVPSAGYVVNLHPVGYAAWFGLLATAMNLVPIGQLDGGHISYAVLGHRSTYVTFIMLGMAIVLSYLASSWIVWTVLVSAMLVFFGWRHPRPIDEHGPLGRTRLILALAAIAIFALSFTPVPVRFIEVIIR